MFFFRDVFCFPTSKRKQPASRLVSAAIEGGNRAVFPRAVHRTSTQRPMRVVKNSGSGIVKADPRLAVKKRLIAAVSELLRPNEKPEKRFGNPVAANETTVNSSSRAIPVSKSTSNLEQVDFLKVLSILRFVVWGRSLSKLA